jgi:hypothetical protein
MLKVDLNMVIIVKLHALKGCVAEKSQAKQAILS